MNSEVSQLAQSLLQKESVEQCSIEELQQLAASYPYFAPAQLLLAKKLQGENEELYQKQLHRTLLHFSNPLWAGYLLTDKGIATETAPAKEITSPVEEIAAPVEAIPAEQPAAEPELITGSADDTDAPVEETQLTATAISLAEMTIQPATGNELLFEPYHTVDYFASQGIKLREDDKPQDKFGQQLRSFTDWLKTLKKQPLAEITQQVAPVSEKKVEELAEHSLDDKEVVTEAMAEVWEKQGSPQRAIAIYTKLSLLEPAKSTYFAAKIDELKKLI